MLASQSFLFGGGFLFFLCIPFFLARLTISLIQKLFGHLTLCFFFVVVSLWRFFAMFEVHIFDFLLAPMLS